MRNYGAQSVLTVPLRRQAICLATPNCGKAAAIANLPPRKCRCAAAWPNKPPSLLKTPACSKPSASRLRLAHTLQAVGALLTAEMSLNEVFDYIFDLLAHVVRYDSVSIPLLSEDQILFAAGRGFKDIRQSDNIIRKSLVPNRRTLGKPHQRVMVVTNTDTIHAGTRCPAVSRSFRGSARRCA